MRSAPAGSLIAAAGLLLLTAKPVPAAPASADGADVRLLSLNAEKAFSSGRLPEAERLYSEALASSPASSRLLVSLAAVKTRLGKTGESVALLRKALSLDLENGAAWLLLGMNALEQNRDEEALADLMQATLRDGRNPRAHNYLGIAAGRKGWSDVSEQELRKSVELDPSYADANFNLAVFYLARTPPLTEMARRHYQRALDLGSPRDPALEARLAKAVASPSPSSATSAALP